MEEKPNLKFIEHWYTVDFTPTTGLVNRYSFNDGSEIETPCPGFLKQELRSHETLRLTESGKYQREEFEVYEPPYEIQFVAADIERGVLESATDVDNYLGTAARDSQ